MPSERASSFPKTVQCGALDFPHLRGRPAAAAVTAVHGHGEPDVEVLVEHLSAERHPLAEHVHGHEAERLPVHEEALRVHRGEVVRAHQAADPPLHVLAQPRSRICKE